MADHLWKFIYFAGRTEKMMIIMFHMTEKTDDHSLVQLLQKGNVVAGGGFGKNQINGVWHSSNSIIL